MNGSLLIRDHIFSCIFRYIHRDRSDGNHFCLFQPEILGNESFLPNSFLLFFREAESLNDSASLCFRLNIR